MTNRFQRLRTLAKTIVIAGLCAVAPAQAAEPLQMTINGSNTIGAKLAPMLVQGMLQEAEVSNLQAELNQRSREHQLSGVDKTLGPLRIRINAHGSSTGFRGLLDRSGQIAASSRPIRDSEVEQLSASGNMRSVQAEQIIGLDGLAIIIHPDNQLRELSVEQLADIFSGRVNNWRQLGGHAGAIKIYARDHNSGTWETFSELVLSPYQLELHGAASRYKSNQDLSRDVSRDINGIGFVGLDSIGAARALAISAGDSHAMLPTKELVATEDYPLTRRLYLYLRPDEDNRLALQLTSFAQSLAGQQLVDEAGFVGQNIKAISVPPRNDMPVRYRELADNAQRLSVNFRFAEGSAQLDNKARQDIDRLLAYLREHNKGMDRVVLVGFGDPGRRNAGLLSRLRASAISLALTSNGVAVKDFFGLADKLPVADNSTENGRIKNRRVEVWVY